MRRAFLACLLLGACGAGGPPLTLEIPTLPGATHLRMPESAPLRRWQYRMQVKSRIRKDVKLEARFEAPAPEGMVVRVADPVVPRQGTGRPTLVVIVPEAQGPFSGTITISSPDVPDWSVTYTFAGDVGTLKGRWLRPRPPGENVGKLRPGEEKPFAIALVSYGSEPVTIREWTADDPERLRLRPSASLSIAPGGEFQFSGVVVAPRIAGPFETRFRVQSDAENTRDGFLVVALAGEVAPDYTPIPPRLVEQAAYPVQEAVFPVEIRAKEGVQPFVVARATGHERYFAIESLGSPEPAARQLVKLKLKRDAPTSVSEPAVCQVRFRIEPAGVEIAWPVEIRLYPPIHAFPRELHFGVVPKGTEKEAEVRLTAFANRSFRVTSAVAEQRAVRVSLPDHAPGTAWVVAVALPGGLEPGFVRDRVVITTDDPDVPELIVPVMAEVR
jgi:hypothetical protein